MSENDQLCCTVDELARTNRPVVCNDDDIQNIICESETSADSDEFVDAMSEQPISGTDGDQSRNSQTTDNLDTKTNIESSDADRIECLNGSSPLPSLERLSLENAENKEMSGRAEPDQQNICSTIEIDQLSDLIFFDNDVTVPNQPTVVSRADTDTVDGHGHVSAENEAVTQSEDQMGQNTEEVRTTEVAANVPECTGNMLQAVESGPVWDEDEFLTKLFQDEMDEEARSSVEEARLSDDCCIHPHQVLQSISHPTNEQYDTVDATMSANGIQRQQQQQQQQPQPQQQQQQQTQQQQTHQPQPQEQQPRQPEQSSQKVQIQQPPQQQKLPLQQQQQNPQQQTLAEEANEAKFPLTSYQTPQRATNASAIDSRTITRPNKSRIQQLPEAIVSPLGGGDQPKIAENAPPEPKVEAAVVAPESQQTAPVVSQAVAVQPISRDEKKSSHRTRQRTVTLQSQINTEIASAFKDVKQMNIEDTLGELERRMQALMVAREKDWISKHEKIAQMLVHEQRRNEPLEQKAAERLLAIEEYEKLVNEFVEVLKDKKSQTVKTNGEVIAAGGPGPERVLSPDDIAALIKERDHLAEDLNSLEISYGDLFRRYDKLRQTCIEIRQSEENTKSASEETARRYALLAEKFDMLRRNAEEQLELANAEIDRMIKQHESDTLGLRLKVKQLESKNESLVISLEAKKKEVENMTALFEEVIYKTQADDEECTVTG